MAEVIFEGRLDKITKTKMKFRDMDSLVYELPYTDDALIQISKLKGREEFTKDYTYKFTVEGRVIIKVEIGKMRERLEEAGAIDVDIILTGVPERRRSRLRIVQTELENLQRELKGPVPKDELIDRVMKVSKLTRKDIESLIDSLKSIGSIWEPRPGFLSRIYR